MLILTERIASKILIQVYFPSNILLQPAQKALSLPMICGPANPPGRKLFLTDKIYPMVKNSIFLFALFSLFISCKRENPQVVNAAPVGESVWVKSETDKKTDELKANASDGGDPKGMMTKALQTLQSSYLASKGKVPNVDDVTVLIDDNLTLIIENKSGSNTTSTQVNLKSLDTDFKHIEILSDNQGNDHLGFRIKLLPGAAKVDVFKNGTKEKELDYLEVILAERSDVHRSISAVTMAAQIAQNTLPIGVDK
jgi:hypothetical protein